ncbi:hypothetical protein F5887DRAFT_289592 [Amanita rubescens]|nr:hypothetical protein F5887DRAFT_289592 [Amanita rubescens]
MLVLGADSSCDICLDHFADGQKVPHVIRCGHVFCLDCASNFSPPECPLCRTPYEYGTWLKLHADMSALTTTSSESSDTEVRRLQDVIRENVDSETTEAYIRQLLYECQNFLEEQPNSTHEDLQTTCRLLSHLCDVKRKLHSQSIEMESLQDKIVQLTTEKEEASRNDHDQEQQTAQLAKDKSELQARLSASESLCQSLLEQVSAFQLYDDSNASAE